MTNTFAIAIPETLTNQQTELRAALTSIEAKQAELVNQRKEIETNLARIDRAISVLLGELPIAAPQTTGKRVMSEEAKQKIREAMLKRSAAAKTAVAAPSVPETAAAADPTPVTTEKPSSGKSAKKVTK